MIYKMVMLVSKSLSKSVLFRKNPITNGFTLMQTSKAVYAEAKPFYYQNTFAFNDTRTALEPALPPLRQNMTTMTYRWPGASKTKDAFIARFVNTCENLATLTIAITRNSLYLGRPNHWFYVPQKLHEHDDATIAEFRRHSDFDSLASIRGVKVVNVDATELLKEPVYIFEGGAAVTPEKIKAFEDFLNRVLTQGKPEPKGKGKGKASSKAKLGASVSHPSYLNNDYLS
jgi:hypothetical protein